MRTKFLSAIFLFISVFLFSPFVKTAKAAFLNFDQSTVSVSTGGTFQIAVIVNAGSDTISSTDVYILYDPTLLEADSVTVGTFFPTVTNNITSGKIYIAGLVDDPATYKTGSGTLATITFKALKDGTGTLTFDCQQGASNSSKIIKNDLNATNIIVCTQNGNSNITVGNGGGGSGGGTPSTLPRTGIIENLTNIAIPGAILLIIGGLLKIVI